MNQSLIIENTKLYVDNQLWWDSSWHDMFHIDRVCSVAKHLWEKESANLFMVEMIALLHEAIDYKMWDKEEDMEKDVRSFLQWEWFTEIEVDKLVHQIKSVWWRWWNNPHKSDDIEVKVVQDSDRIDALWAVGIARLFAFNWSKWMEMHNPSVPLIEFETAEEYKAIVKEWKGTAVNHFYEKLFLLKDTMNTVAWKNLAQQRHEFMEHYLEQFYAERNWEK